MVRFVCFFVRCVSCAIMDASAAFLVGLEWYEVPVLPCTREQGCTVSRVEDTVTDRTSTIFRKGIIGKLQAGYDNTRGKRPVYSGLVRSAIVT